MLRCSCQTTPTATMGQTLPIVGCTGHVRSTPDSSRNRRTTANGASGPITAMSGCTKWLFDDLVGTREQRGRYGEVERLRRLQIDHQLKLGRLLNGEVSWFRALQNLSTKLAARRNISRKSTV